MDISSQRSIAVYWAKNWKLLLARIHHFSCVRSQKKKKKKLTKGDQARTKVGFQLFDYSSH